jgi:hypothetical protein
VHVDDGIMTGKKEEIMEVVALLEKKWKVNSQRTPRHPKP